MLTIKVIKESLNVHEEKLKAFQDAKESEATRSVISSPAVTAAAASSEEEQKLEEFTRGKLMLPEALRVACKVANPEDNSVLTGATFKKIEPPNRFTALSEPSSAGSTSDDEEDNVDEEDDEGSDADIKLPVKQQAKIEKEEAKPKEPQILPHEPDMKKVNNSLCIYSN